MFEWCPKVRKNGGSELRSVLARPAYPRLLCAPTMDSLTQPTSLAQGGKRKSGERGHTAVSNLVRPGFDGSCSDRPNGHSIVRSGDSSMWTMLAVGLATL